MNRFAGWFFGFLFISMMALSAKTIKIDTPRIGSITFYQPSPGRLGEWFKFIKLGKDSNSKQATFEFYTLLGVNHDYGWKLASWELIQDGVKNTVEDADSFLRYKLNEQGIKSRIRGASDVISVGVASCEGHRREEEQRATMRAKVIRRAVESIAETTSGESRILLLGQYDDENCSVKSQNQTLPQRSIIIIGVTQKDPDVNMGQALKDAVRSAAHNESLQRDLSKYFRNPDRTPLGALDPDKYSLFNLKV
jgi:eukaryotic-like serine/threonine-protein kinase